MKNVFSLIVNRFKGSGCEKMFEQKGNEYSFSVNLGMGAYKIDIANFSNKIKEFYKVTETMVSMDTSQFLLCKEIDSLEREEELKKLRQDCIKIRLQLIMAFAQLQGLLASAEERPYDEMNQELGKWIRYMSKLNKRAIDTIRSSKAASSEVEAELNEIMSYQGISKDEMNEALRNLA